MITRGMVALIGLLATCSPALPILIRHDVSADRYLARAQSPELACVGAIKLGNSYRGSCVLVAGRWAITDAHVVKGVPIQELRAILGGKDLPVIGVTIHPDYESEKFKSEPSSLGKIGIDLALIQLAEPVASVTPAVIAAKPVAPGTEVTIAGYGAWGLGNSTGSSFENPPQKRAGSNTIDSIGGDVEGPVSDRYYVTDFDGAGGKNRCGSAEPTDLECVGSGGDSGGGAFVKTSEGWRLVGLYSSTRYLDILSKNPIAYGCLGMYTRLDLFTGWIKHESSK